MDEFLTSLGLDLSPEEQTVIQAALTHRSAVYHGSAHDVHNERLEFLGDAVLELVTTEYLFHTYPEKAEGELTSLRAALVKGQNLAEVARRLELGKYVILSNSEAHSGGKTKSYILANLIEALIGAIYLTKGRNSAEKFIHDYITSDLPRIIDQQLYIDAKSAFQELAQGPSLGITPSYEVLSESGKDHKKEFVVAAYLNKKLVGQGSGGSKKNAQVAAARDALERKSEWFK